MICTYLSLKYTQNEEQGGQLSCLDRRPTPVAGDINRFKSQENL